MSNREISSAQVVLEEVLEAAIDGFTVARQRRDESAAAAFMHILTIAKANVDSLGDVAFANEELSKLDPDALLKSG